MAETFNAESEGFGLSSTGSTSYPEATQGNSGGTDSSGAANILFADKYVFSTPGTVTKVGVYINSGAAGNIYIGLYSDSSGPASLLTTSGSTAVGAGWNDIAVTPYYIAAGTYWIGYVLSSASPHFLYGAGTNTHGYRAYTFGALPDPWGTPTYQNLVFTCRITYVQIKNYAKASKVTLAANSDIESVSFYSHATGNVRLAIYNQSGAAPNALQWESGSTACSATAWATVNISAGTPTTLTLNAGTYWLVWQWDSVNTGPSYTAGAAGDGHWVQQTYGAFPATWSGGTSTAERWSEYGTTTEDTGMGSIWTTFTTGGTHTETIVSERVELAAASDIAGTMREAGLKYLTLHGFPVTGYSVEVTGYLQLPSDGAANARYVQLCLTPTNPAALTTAEANYLRFYLQDNAGTYTRVLAKRISPAAEATIKTQTLAHDSVSYSPLVRIWLDATNVRVDLDGTEWQAATAHGLTFTSNQFYTVACQGTSRTGTGTCLFDGFSVTKNDEAVS